MLRQHRLREQGGGARGEMASRREANNSNELWVDVPLARARTHDRHCLLRVLQRSCRPILHVPRTWRSILQHNACYAESIERLSDAIALLVNRCTFITAAR